MKHSWRAQVLYICLIAGITKGQSLVHLCLVAVVPVVQDDARLVIMSAGKTVVEDFWVNGALNVVRWIYGINMVATWGWNKTK